MPVNWDASVPPIAIGLPRGHLTSLIEFELMTSAFDPQDSAVLWCYPKTMMAKICKDGTSAQKRYSYPTPFGAVRLDTYSTCADYNMRILFGFDKNPSSSHAPKGVEVIAWLPSPAYWTRKRRAVGEPGSRDKPGKAATLGPESLQLYRRPCF